MAQGLITTAQFPMANPTASLGQGLAQGMQLGAQRKQLALQEAEQQRLVQKQQAEAEKLQFERESAANRMKQFNDMLLSNDPDKEAKLFAVDSERAKKWFDLRKDVSALDNDKLNRAKQFNDIAGSTAMNALSLLDSGNHKQLAQNIERFALDFGNSGYDVEPFLNALDALSEGDVEGARAIFNSEWQDAVSADVLFKDKQDIRQTIEKLKLAGIDLSDKEAVRKALYPDKRMYEPEGQKLLAKVYTGIYEEIIGEGRGASASLDYINMAREYAKQLDTGMFTGAELTGKKFLQAFGVNLSDVGLDDDVGVMEAFDALSKRMSLDMVGLTKGAVSDAEMKMFLEMVPGLSRTKEGNLLMLEFMATIAERRVAHANYIASKVSKRGVADHEMLSYSKQFQKDNPFMTKEVKARADEIIARGSTTPSSYTFSDGTTMKRSELEARALRVGQTPEEYFTGANEAIRRRDAGK